MTTVRYFLPEDGDSEHHPNVFLAARPRQPNQPPLLKDIKDAFPLPGQYHFRFKTSLIPGSEQIAVWMDCVDDHRPVPIWRNSIVAKITRLTAEDDDDDDDYDDEEYEDYDEEEPQYANGSHHQPSASASTSANTTRRRNVSASQPPSVRQHQSQHQHQNQHHTPASTSTSDNLLNVFDHHPTATTANTTTTTTTTTTNTSAATNLFDMDHSSTNHSSTGSLLDMETPHSAPPSTHPSVHNDLLGMATGHHPPQQQHQHQHQHQQNFPPQQAFPSSNATAAGAMNVNMNMNMNMNTMGMNHMANNTSLHGRTSASNGNNNKPKENKFDVFADRQGPFGNLNWG